MQEGVQRIREIVGWGRNSIKVQPGTIVWVSKADTANTESFINGMLPTSKESRGLQYNTDYPAKSPIRQYTIL
jgi:hypothetical protein